MASNSSDAEWTAYSLHIPSSLTLYQDMVTVAEMNAGAPHGHLQLLSEAHMVLRAALHRLTWLQVMKPNGLEITQANIDQNRDWYHSSCVKLADHYLQYNEKNNYSLALPYYRMSGLSVMSVLEKFNCSSPLQPGVQFYIEEVVLRPYMNENLVDSGVADKIIEILGQFSLDTLVSLLLNSSTLRGFKSKRSLEYIEGSMRQFNQNFETSADMALAAVLVGGSEDWLSLVPSVDLSKVLLNYFPLLFDQSQSHCESFSELANTVRRVLPAIFCELCVSLIESGILTLGQVLNLLLQTFTSHTPSAATTTVDNAAILQLFLETYFVELLAQTSDIKSIIPLDVDHQQAVTTLVRSYLAALSNYITTPQIDVSMPYSSGELYGPRKEYLDLIDPLSSEEDSRLDNLLKLQSLLCSPVCDDLCKETVQRYPGLYILEIVTPPPQKKKV